MSFVPIIYFPEEMAELLNLIYENISEIMQNKTIRNVTKAVVNFTLIITVTAILHWSFVNIYISNCFESSWSGAITNMIRLGSPLCQFVNYAQFELSKHYITIWASAGIAIIAWFASKSQPKTIS